MDHLAADSSPTAVFGEPAYDTVATKQVSPSTSAASELAVSDLIAKYPLLAVTAGAVAILAVVAMRKGTASGGTTQKQLARYARFMEKAARREYHRADVGNRIATVSRSLGEPVVRQFVTQALEDLQRVVAAKKR